MSLEPISSVGTVNVGGNRITPSQSTVYANGTLVHVDGDNTYPHSLHPPNPVPSTSANVYINGKKILRRHDTASCGHQLLDCEVNIRSS